MTMRQFLIFLMLLLPLGLTAQVDDMYFVPKKKKTQEVETRDNTNVLITTQERIGTTRLTERDEDEYNRRPSAAATESEYYDEEGVEYSEDDYQESGDDVEYFYSSRIVRFHSPHRVIVSSPWYWDVVYTSDIDNWVLYDDGIYWEFYPVYTPWYHASWSWNWGWPCHSWAYYSGWGHWHTPHYWWHSGHYGHYHPHFGGHFAGSGHYRDGRIPPITNMRGGTGIAHGTNIERGSVARRGEFLQGDVAQSGNRGAVSRSTGRGGNRSGTSVERSTSVRRGEAARSSVNGSKQQDRTGSRTAVRGNSGREKTYDRPSSTRTTSRSSKVERSSSSERSSGSRSSFSSGSSRSSGSSVSRSSGGGSRSSGGGAARGGGSRGGGRR